MQVTNRKVIQTLRQILHPTRGKVLLLTSTSIEPTLHKLYAEAPLGPLRKTALTVEHGKLANDFACWGSWDGAEDFGKNSDLVEPEGLLEELEELRLEGSS